MFRPVTNYSILAGTPNLLDDASGQRRDLATYKVHPKYDDGEVLNDIAICKVASPFVFNEKVGPIQPGNEIINGGVNCTLTGWGSLSQNRTSSSIPFWGVIAYPMFLQTINLTTITNDQCNQMWDE